MAFQFSDPARNAIVNGIVTAVGAAPTLEIRNGSVPADETATATGTVLVTMLLPSVWMNGASGGVATLAGQWQDLTADNAGTATYFRIRQGATTHIQGTVSATGGGGDMTLDNPVISLNQQVTVTSFTLTAGG